MQRIRDINLLKQHQSGQPASNSSNGTITVPSSYSSNGNAVTEMAYIKLLT